MSRLQDTADQPVNKQSVCQRKTPKSYSSKSNIMCRDITLVNISDPILSVFFIIRIVFFFILSNCQQNKLVLNFATMQSAK